MLVAILPSAPANPCNCSDILEFLDDLIWNSFISALHLNRAGNSGSVLAVVLQPKLAAAIDRAKIIWLLGVVPQTFQVFPIQVNIYGKSIVKG